MPFLLILEILFLGLLTAVTIWIYRRVTYWNRIGIPTPGFLAQFSAYKKRQGSEVEIEFYREYGPIYGIYMLFTPILIIGSETHMKDITIKDFNNFRNHTSFPIPDHRFAFNPLFQRDDLWKKLRGVITPSFSSGKFRSMATDAMIPCLDTFIQNMTKLIKEDPGHVISAKKYFDCLMTDIIVSCTYGVKIDCMNDPNNEIAIRAKQIFKTLIDSFSLTGHLFLDKSCFDYISKLTMDLVAERRKENLSSVGVKGRADFLQVLVDAKYENKLTDDQICGFGMSFFSDEGTSTTLTALAYFLAKNPDVQNKLHEEVQQIQNEVNFDTVASLTYLDAVIKETLRMWPSGYRLDRVAAENYKLEGTNITIPAGMTVQLPTYAFQHDPKIYSEPNKFKPERFIVHSEFNPIPPPFYGFGAGPRTCIAQRLATLNLKLTVVKLLNHLWFESTPETKLECLEGQQILVFTKDVYLKLVPR